MNQCQPYQCDYGPFQAHVLDSWASLCGASHPDWMEVLSRCLALQHCIMSVSWCSDEAVRIMPNDTWLTTCIYRIYSLRQGATSKTCLSFSFSKSCACDALDPEFNAWLLVITFRNTIELILLLATWCQGGMAFPERHSAVALWEISQQDLGSRKPIFCWV